MDTKGKKKKEKKEKPPKEPKPKKEKKPPAPGVRPSKMVLCRVLLLDGNDFEVEIDVSTAFYLLVPSWGSKIDFYSYSRAHELEF